MQFFLFDLLFNIDTTAASSKGSVDPLGRLVFWYFERHSMQNPSAVANEPEDLGMSFEFLIAGIFL
jgi:hypothetical protein